MEGTRCCQPGCSIHDFLPFECPKCEKFYCLDHRSRFTHDCKAAIEPEAKSGEESTGFSVKGLFQSITDRFSSSSSPVVTHSQHAVHSSKPSVSTTDKEKFQSTLQRLDNSSNSTSNDKTKRISSKTREMLIKSRATGNDSCVSEDRVFFMLHFEPLPPSAVSASRSPPLKEEGLQQEEGEVARLAEESIASIKASVDSVRYLFFSRHVTLAELLYQVKQQYPDLILFIARKLGVAADVADVGLSIQTRDTPDWEYWTSADVRNLPLHQLFTNFEEVWLKILPLSQVLTLQQNPALRKADVKASAATSPSPSTSTATSTAAEVKREYRKGDRVWYYKALQPASDVAPSDTVFSSFLEAYEHREHIILHLADVVAIHHDDFPNIYYTIRLLPSGNLSTSSSSSGSSGEKQTDLRHLLPYHPSEEKIVLDQRLQSALRQYQTIGSRVLRLHIFFKNQEVSVLSLGDGVTIGQLRQIVVQYLLPQLASTAKQMKLICKGMILKDEASTLAKNAKIVDGAKIIVMGSGDA